MVLGNFDLFNETNHENIIKTLTNIEQNSQSGWVNLFWNESEEMSVFAEVININN